MRNQYFQNITHVSAFEYIIHTVYVLVCVFRHSNNRWPFCSRYVVCKCLIKGFIYECTLGGNEHTKKHSNQSTHQYSIVSKKSSHINYFWLIWLFSSILRNPDAREAQVVNHEGMVTPSVIYQYSSAVWQVFHNHFRRKGNSYVPWADQYVSISLALLVSLHELRSGHTCACCGLCFSNIPFADICKQLCTVLYHIVLNAISRLIALWTKESVLCVQRSDYFRCRHLSVSQTSEKR